MRPSGTSFVKSLKPQNPSKTPIHSVCDLRVLMPSGKVTRPVNEQEQEWIDDSEVFQDWNPNFSFTVVGD